jgi:DNA anti-recombination protein RmuC
MGPNTLAAFLDTIIVGHNHVKLNENAAKISKIIREIQLEFSNFDSSTESVIKRLDGALKDVQKLQTRVNVLGSRLEKGAENLKEEE